MKILRLFAASPLLWFATTPLAAQPTIPTVGGGNVSLASGVPTVVTVIDSQRGDDAKRVGDQITDEEFAKGKVRVITVLNFDGKLAPSMHSITRAQVELDIQKSATRLGPIYRSLGVSHSPREDLHVVLDLTGEVSRKLSVEPGQPVTVLFYDGSGKLRYRFNGVPGARQFREYLDPLLQ